MSFVRTTYHATLKSKNCFFELSSCAACGGFGAGELAVRRLRTPGSLLVAAPYMPAAPGDGALSCKVMKTRKTPNKKAVHKYGWLSGLQCRSTV